ncbi:MAG TPA: hypothetical protein VFG53_19865 [Anaeromyxobacter sp.]|nr:hypothetical protein [Anaeromyxobacter sp.]
MTNLRLPGQYDERLLGNLGLQGPYYNWNRWYLPAVGRYMELDPLLLSPRAIDLLPSKARQAFGEGELLNVPSWYGYAGENPLTYVDPTGLDRYEACKNKQLGPFGKWVCKKCVDWRCNKNPGEQKFCCDADRADCETTAGDDGNQKAVCMAKYLECMAKLKGGE